MQQPYKPHSFHDPASFSLHEQQMRRDHNYIGIMMIILIFSMQFAFVILSLLSVAVGLISLDQLQMSSLGLDNTHFLLFYACTYALSMGFIPVLVSFCSSEKRGNPFTPSKACRSGAAFFGVLFGVGGCMLANVITNYFLLFLSRYDVPIPESPQFMIHTPTSLLMGLFVMAVLPALLEEMVFRGFVLRTLRRYGDWYAIVISSVLFSLMHGNIRQIPFALIVGIILGWLYTATNNIWLPIAVHFANNGISVLLDYLGFSQSEDQYVLTNFIVITYLSIIGVASFIVLVVRYKELFKRRTMPSIVSFGQKCRGYFSSPGQLIALFLFIIVMVVEFLNA